LRTATLARWVAGILIATAVIGVPCVYFRYKYTFSKRLREVVEGKVYRAGQLTLPGFRDAVTRHKIRTIINLQDELSDPEIDAGYFTTETIAESEMCSNSACVTST